MMPAWNEGAVRLARRAIRWILFDNGWEIRIPFRDVRLKTVRSIYPCPPSGILSPAPNPSQIV